MGADNGLDDVKTQSPTVPVTGAGFVDFMEPVKYQRKLLGRDGLAGIGNGNVSLTAAFPDLQAQGTALGTEFHCVVQQVVDHLGDGILIRPGEDGMLRQ